MNLSDISTGESLIGDVVLEGRTVVFTVYIERVIISNVVEVSFSMPFIKRLLKF